MSLKEYLEGLKAKSATIELGEYDPRELPLTRRSYGFMGKYVVLGLEPDDPIAREKSREVMVGFYDDLKKRPDNIHNIITHAESLKDHFYYERAEVLFGRALTIDSENPHTYHLLAKNHLGWAQLCRRNKSIASKHHTLAKELGKEGLRIIDRTSLRLVEDVLDAASNLGEHEERSLFGRKMEIRFME